MYQMPSHSSHAKFCFIGNFVSNHSSMIFCDYSLTQSAIALFNWKFYVKSKQHDLQLLDLLKFQSEKEMNKFWKTRHGRWLLSLRQRIPYENLAEEFLEELYDNSGSTKFMIS